MKVEENGVLTFEHVSHHRRQAANDSLILVWFDGEADQYWCPAGKEVYAHEELKAFYRQDWGGTNRVLPMTTYRFERDDEIDCR